MRVGRCIAPTERAVGLEQPLRSILDDLRALTTAPVFDPTNTNLRVTIAANDFQRDLLLPQASRRANETLKSLTLTIILSGIPSAELLTDSCAFMTAVCAKRPLSAKTTSRHAISRCASGQGNRQPSMRGSINKVSRVKLASPLPIFLPYPRSCAVTI